MGQLPSTPDSIWDEPIIAFKRGTKDDEELNTTQLTKQATEILSTLATFVNIIPGIGIEVKLATATYKEGLKWIYALISNQKINEALIFEIINKEFARNATMEIQAKIRAIKNRIEQMENGDKLNSRNEATAALNSCEEILELFDNQEYYLWKAVVPSSELLIAFVVIYADVIMRTLELMPHYQTHLVSEFNKIVKTLEKYKNAAITTRLNEVYITASIYPDDGLIQNRVYTIRGDGKWIYNGTGGSEDNINFEKLKDWNNSKLSCWDGSSWKGCMISKITDTFRSCSQTLRIDASVIYTGYKNELQNGYEKVFNDVIEKLNRLRSTLNIR